MCCRGELCITELLPSCSLSSSEPVDCQKPCKNGGDCVGLNRCRCTTGFTGDLCEQGWSMSVEQCLHVHYVYRSPFWISLRVVSAAVTTPCVPPCQHGGTCSPRNSCTCPEGTAGLRCERLWVSFTPTAVVDNTYLTVFVFLMLLINFLSKNRYKFLKCIAIHAVLAVALHWKMRENFSLCCYKWKSYVFTIAADQKTYILWY